MDGKTYGEHESYATEIKFYSELKTKRVNDYTYLDVLEKELLYKFISKKNKIYAHCQSLGDIPILKLNKRPSLLGEAGPYTERYLNYLKYSFNSSYDELCPYHFVLDFRIDVSELITDEIIVHKYLETYNEPENGIRALFGLPKIGEGWISETNLFYEIKSQFSDVVVFQHARPEWLEKQHLDIYLPKYNIGIEFQGDQHFYPVEYFGGEASFIKNQERDKKKRMLCEENSCVLMYVKPGYSKSEVLLEIGNRISVQKAKVNRPSSNQSV